MAERWERRRAQSASDTSTFQAEETQLTLRATSLCDCEEDVREPVAEQDGVATQTDLTSACVDGTREEQIGCHQVIREPQVPQLCVRTGSTKALYSLSLLFSLIRSLLHHTVIRVRYAAAASCFLLDTSCESPNRDPRDLTDLHGIASGISWWIFTAAVSLSHDHIINFPFFALAEVKSISLIGRY